MAKHQDLQVLGGIAVGEHHEQLDGAAEGQVGELQQHAGSLRNGVGGGVTLQLDARANSQLRGHVRLSASYGLGEEGVDVKGRSGHPAHAPIPPCLGADHPYTAAASGTSTASLGSEYRIDA